MIMLNAQLNEDFRTAKFFIVFGFPEGEGKEWREPNLWLPWQGN